MLILVVRTLILYGMVIAAMRIMGKRQLGELQPSELVVAIMISDLASVPDMSYRNRSDLPSKYYSFAVQRPYRRHS